MKSVKPYKKLAGVDKNFIKKREGRPSPFYEQITN
jgi:hypothetical protein